MKMLKETSVTLYIFHIFTIKLNKHAPKKEKFISGNSKPHVNRNLRRAILKILDLKIIKIKRSILMIAKTMKDKETM